jgi:hypothetical protein
MKLVELMMRSDNNRFARKANRGSNMATEGHRHVGKKSTRRKHAGMDRELAEIMAKIDELKLKLRQDKRMIYDYEPETGEGLDDDEEDELGSSEDLKDCQEGRKEEIPFCQEGNELRSVEDLKDCREDSQGISNCQLGNDKRSLRDLEDCQEGSGSILNCQVGRYEDSRPSEGLMDSMESSIQQELLMKMGSVDLMVFQGSSSRNIPYFQVGRDEQRNLGQPEVLTEQMRSQRDQQVHLTEVKEHQGDILMIGGIQLFLPSAQEEAETSVENTATAGEQSQLMMTVSIKQKKKKKSWSRHLRLPKEMKGRMSVLRNNSIISASKLKEL